MIAVMNARKVINVGLLTAGISAAGAFAFSGFESAVFERTAEQQVGQPPEKEEFDPMTRIIGSATCSLLLVGACYGGSRIVHSIARADLQNI